MKNGISLSIGELADADVWTAFEIGLRHDASGNEILDGHDTGLAQYIAHTVSRVIFVVEKNEAGKTCIGVFSPHQNPIAGALALARRMSGRPVDSQYLITICGEVPFNLGAVSQEIMPSHQILDGIHVVGGGGIGAGDGLWDMTHNKLLDNAFGLGPLSSGLMHIARYRVLQKLRAN